MYHLTMKSGNAKAGPIPVSTSTATTCPDACPLKARGCYAKAGGPLAMHWRRVTDGRSGGSWASFVGAVRAIPDGQLWRHNQAGDLAGDGVTLDRAALRQLTAANTGKRGFTYTHYDPTVGLNGVAIADAIESGFTVNLSADGLADADALADLGIAPVVTVLPVDQMTNTRTPKGRAVVVCPAVTREGVTCASCGMCQRAQRNGVIVGFPAHGAQAKAAAAIAAQ